MRSRLVLQSLVVNEVRTEKQLGVRDPTASIEIVICPANYQEGIVLRQQKLMNDIHRKIPGFKSA